ncbi:MAG TPA: DUF2079 domain-containing protein [Ardenticatenaceae bacterium]
MSQRRIPLRLRAALSSPTASAAPTLEAQPASGVAARRWQRHLPYLVLLALGTTFLVVLSLLNHRALNTGYDLGIYDQTIWNLSQGRIWQTTLVYETAGYYDHFEPILVLFVPLYWLWPDVRVLLIAQAVALGLGSLPIYLYAYRRLGTATRASVPIALAIAAAYLAYPALHHANLNDFHEVALLPPLLGFALYGLLTGQRRVMFIFLGLCLLVKEDVAVTALAFGVYIMLLKPHGFRRRDGLFVAAFAVTWALLVLYLFYPALTRGLPYPFVSRRYSWLGDSPADAARVLLTQPWVLLPHLLQGPKLQFLMRLFAPLLFLPLLGWPVIGLALPVLGYLMLSSYEPQWSVQSYYNPPLLPVLFFALVTVFYRVQQRVPARHSNRVLAGLAASVLLSVGVAYVLDAPGPGSRQFHAPRFQISEEDEAAYQLMAKVPDEASLGSLWWLIPHLTHRRQIDVVLDRPEQPPDYLLIEERPGVQSAPIYPYAAPPGPLLFHEYGPVDAAGPYRMLQLQRSLPLVPLDEPEPAPTPLSLAAYLWPDSPNPAEPPTVTPGQEVRLVLAWRRTGTLDRHYVFFVHVLDPRALNESGQPTLVTQNDHEPGNARFPTNQWETWTNPEIVLDEQRIYIPAELAPGSYDLYAGAYEQQTMERVELGGPGQSLVPLGQIQVVAPDGE